MFENSGWFNRRKVSPSVVLSTRKQDNNSSNTRKWWESVLLRIDWAVLFAYRNKRIQVFFSLFFVSSSDSTHPVQTHTKRDRQTGEEEDKKGKTNGS